MKSISSEPAVLRIAAPAEFKSIRPLIAWRKVGLRSVVLSMLWLFAGAAVAANHFTEKQMDAFAERVGKIFWIRPADGKLPLIRTAPAAGAATFLAEERQSFEIVELAGRANNNPYYKVKFASGKEGYVTPESFHEQLNLTILTVDPYADEGRKAEEAAKDEKARVEWIQSQPWPPAIKKAAIEKQPVPGLTTAEIKKVLGEPSRVHKLRGPSKITEERWYYPNGKVLTFYNQLLSAVQQQEKK